MNLTKNMKVKELIEKLLKLDGDTDIILQKDSEGNGYSPLDGVDSNAVYIKNSDYSGDIYSLQWTHDDACMSFEEWNELKKQKKCVVLYPMN